MSDESTAALENEQTEGTEDVETPSEQDSPAHLSKKLSKYEYILSQEFVDSFWELVKKRPDGDCWQWMGTLHQQGFGRLRSGGHEFASHRVAWELAHGPIPSNRTVVHKEGVCNNRGCCNPEHYELGDPHDKRQRKGGGQPRIRRDPGYYDEKMMPSMFHVKHLAAYDGVKVFMDPQEEGKDLAPDLAVIKKGLLSIIRRQEAQAALIRQLREGADDGQPQPDTSLVEAVAAISDKLDALAERLEAEPAASAEPDRIPGPPSSPFGETLGAVLGGVFRERASVHGRAGQIPSVFDRKPLIEVNNMACLEAADARDATALLQEWLDQYLMSPDATDETVPVTPYRFEVWVRRYLTGQPTPGR